MELVVLDFYFFYYVCWSLNTQNMETLNSQTEIPSLQNVLGWFTLIKLLFATDKENLFGMIPELRD